jgi:hemerythrin superfamily protein
VRSDRGAAASRTGVLQTAGSAVGKAIRQSTAVVTEAGSDLVNTARGMLATAVSGQRDAIGVLKSHHRHVERLFARALSSEDVRVRKQLMEEVGAFLAMHTKIEEDIFYPAVRQLGGESLEELVDEAFEEHHVVDLVLAELPRVNPRDDRFRAKMTVLSELVEHHVKEEERDMFTRARALGPERLQELGDRLQRAAARHAAKLPEA